MTWLWQDDNWPEFSYQSDQLTKLEAQFLRGSGTLIGTWRHLGDDDKLDIEIDWLSSEAIDTSAIEGEFLNRDSVQSSVRRQFGLKVDALRSAPAEAGIAEMMVDLYRNFDAPLSDTCLFEWHRMVANGRRDLDVIGGWRTHAEPMQVVSGALHKPKVHYEAPPSDAMVGQMDRFMEWFNKSHNLPALTRAGIAHLYFVCVHPFEDGNGRIGRAVAEKSLAQSLGQPSLTALSQTISKNRKAYYDALEAANKHLEITDWLVYFAETILAAQRFSEHKLVRLIDKTKMFDRLRGQLNPRQEKILVRLFRAEPDGFIGGLSSANYRQVTGASVPTATRDLNALVKLNALTKTGERRYTRYFLNVPALDQND